MLTSALLAFTLFSPQAPAESRPEITWEAYELRTDDGPIAAELGRLQVPERRGAPDARMITLAFARIRSTSPAPGAPIIYLDGGPGGSGVGVAQTRSEEHTSELQSRE